MRAPPKVPAIRLRDRAASYRMRARPNPGRFRTAGIHHMPPGDDQKANTHMATNAVVQSISCITPVLTLVFRSMTLVRFTAAPRASGGG
jgi:hypothetical protein